MKQLLSMYSLRQFFIFVIILALAIKQFISFLDWFNERIGKKVDKDRKASTLENQIQQILEERRLQIIQLKNNDIKLQANIQELTKKIDMLISSDRDDIKAWLTAQHHHFIEKGSIDYYSLDCISKRYQHYKKEGGNTFIDDLMEEINSLPKTGKKQNNT